MSHNSTLKFITTTTLISHTINAFVELNFSSNIRLTRYLLHLIIFILFISLLIFVNHFRKSIRPFSKLSRFIISIGIIGLVLNDVLVINGVTHQLWCSIHQIFLHFLLMIILLSRLLPDFYEYTNQYYHQYDSSKLKSIIIFNFIILLCIQLFISIKCLWNNSLINNQWNSPVLCQGNIRPQLFIFILHLFDLLFTIQSIRTPIIVDDVNPQLSISVFINEKFCQLNSILLRLFYFTGASILHMLFLPGQFSATFYGGILVMEFVLKYLIVIYHKNVKYERNIDSMNGMINTGYLSLKNDDLSDDSRLLNNID